MKRTGRQRALPWEKQVINLNVSAGGNLTETATAEEKEPLARIPW